MFPKRQQTDAEETTRKSQPLSVLRSWSWLPNYSKVPRKEVQQITTDPDPVRRWIKGVVICSWIIGGVLALNIILTIIAASLAYSGNSGQIFSFASLYMGKCSTSKNWTTGLHLLINILSTTLIGASNYCMQCLAAPSREQVDKAHSQKTWVRIGVPNIIDLIRYQTGKRRFLGSILLITSLPIHLIYNSAVYFSIGPTEYSVVAAHEELIQEHGNSTEFEQCFTANVGMELPSFNTAIHDGSFNTLSKQECVDIFAQDYTSGYGTVVLVTKDSMPQNESVAWIGTGNRQNFEGGNSQFSWLCDEEYPCTKSIAEENTQNWTVHAITWSRPTIHLSVPIPGGLYESGGWLDVGHYGVPETEDYNHLDDILDKYPTLEDLQAELDNPSGWVNSSFPGSVTVRKGEPDCTYPGVYVKLICALLAARENRKDIFLTTGDAIASFLAKPDPATEGACLLSGSLIKKSTQGWQKYKGRERKSLDLLETKQETPLRLPPRKRWFQAASISRWVYTILLFVCMLIPSVIVLRLGILNYNKASKSKNLWDSGLGDASTGTTLAGLSIPATASGIFSMIFMANIPQILVSLAYFFYNGLLTCMLGAVEYDNYATEQKPLRVSWPRGGQRSTYYLSLPYRYSVPLLVVSAVLHWLVSQSFFFVQVIPFDRHGVPQKSYPDVLVTCGYSPVAIIFGIIVGGFLPIVAVLLGLRRFRSHMPLAGQCSAAISAACHPMTTAVDHALKPVQWGEVPDRVLSHGIFSNTITTDVECDARHSVGNDEQRLSLATELDLNDSRAVGFLHCSFTSEDVTLDENSIMADNNTASCPFCPFTDSDANFVSQHIEFCHPDTGATGFLQENPQEFAAQNSAPLPVDEDGTDKYVDCPHGCGETIESAELSSHLDLHVAEDMALDDIGVTSARSTPDVHDHVYDEPFDDEDSLDMLDSHKGGKRGMQRDSSRVNTAKPPRPHSPPRTTNADGTKRLGRSELGPHAHEKKMPSWLKKMLEKGGSISKQTQITSDGKFTRRDTVENETDHLIPVLARLCEQDKSVQRAFFCSPKVRHICKMRREGGFCGYRNIQMMVSWLKKSRGFGHEHFPNKGPTILELQDMIESAWDMGFNSSGRAETGGIKDTRKFIGTPEAQALFMSLGIPCEARSLSERSDLRACDALYIDVADYFRSACSPEDETKIVQTDLPPIYFQHQGHSMTIIGFEIRDNGSANLLVFDPMFKTSPAMERLIGAFVKPSDPTRLLKAYRRGTPYLQKYKIFELLKLCITSPKHEAT
ncbi:Peptidase C78, ubiquitin fold modifier-specific peptidase 1/ 2 [Penicillium expansum]|nr:Peptidase C78, ubiquitin fold modifier-specific peptidase 1/ 2 [Penicillium expansum]